MPVTVEQNKAIKKAIRNDLRYIVPGVPNRYFYRRGGWRPQSFVPAGAFINGAPGEGEEITPAPPAPSPVPLYETAEFTEKAIINIATAATHTIIAASPGRSIQIFFLTFTVGGEVNITLYEGADAFTGAMDFGGAGEPRGIVMPHDGKAIVLKDSRTFRILLSAAIQVSGIVLYRYV